MTMTTMKSTTLSRRTEQLIKQIENHSHKQELLQIIREQLVDDTDLVTNNTKHSSTNG